MSQSPFSSASQDDDQEKEEGLFAEDELLFVVDAVKMMQQQQQQEEEEELLLSQEQTQAQMDSEVEDTGADQNTQEQCAGEEDTEPQLRALSDVFSDDEEEEEATQAVMFSQVSVAAMSMATEADDIFGGDDSDAHSALSNEQDAAPQKKPSSKKEKQRKATTVQKDDDEEFGDDAEVEAEDAEEEASAKFNPALEAELDAIRRLEQGPTEAEKARRKLIELDEDVLEEKIERFKKAGLRVMSKLTGLSETERRQELRACRAFLAPLWKTEDYADIIEAFVEKQNRRVYGKDDTILADALLYLEQDSFSDEEEEKEAAVMAAPKEEEKMIALSDSEDEDEDDSEEEEEVAVEQQPASAALAAVSSPASKMKMQFGHHQGSHSNGGASSEPRRLNMSNVQKLMQSRVSSNSRSALMVTLRRQVHLKATENYCSHMKVSTEDLSLQLEIAEKCRKLVSLLKERFEEKSLLERERRRELYRKLAKTEDEEFDEDGDDQREHEFISEEERRRVLAELRAEFDQEEEEEDDEDEDYNAEEDEEDGELPDALAEELDANAELAVQDQEDDEGGAKAEASGDATGVQEEEDEEGGVVLGRKKSKAGRSFRDDDEDNDNVEDGEMTEEATQLQALGADEDGLADSEDGEGDEAADAGEARRKKKKDKARTKVNTGNALYRMQLEAEERAHRGRRNIGLFDEEAEEEEEEGHQAGLGDFGFGVTSKHKENEDESNALRFRKGDLDHIVDELGSDDEGDEEAARKARMEMEMQEENAQTRKIITAITEGHDALKRQQRKKGFTFDQLVNAGDGKKSGDVSAGAVEELDEEELLIQGFKQRAEMEKRGRALGGDNSDDEEELGEEENDSEYEREMMESLTNMTEEQRAKELVNMERKRELERAEALRRKQMLHNFQMRRQLRREAHRQQDSQQPSQAASSNAGNSLIRPSAARLLQGSRQRVPVISRTASSSSSTSNNNGYRGALQKKEIDGGYGMGMAITANSSTLFSMVTSANNPAGGAANRGLKRSYSSLHQLTGSGAANKTSSSLTSTVATSHFVYMDTSSHHGTADSFLGAPDSNSMLSKPSKLQRVKSSASVSNGLATTMLQRSSSMQSFSGDGDNSNGGAGASFFAKLGGARGNNGMLKRSHTVFNA